MPPVNLDEVRQDANAGANHPLASKTKHQNILFDVTVGGH